MHLGKKSAPQVPNASAAVKRRRAAMIESEKTAKLKALSERKRERGY